MDDLSNKPNRNSLRFGMSGSSNYGNSQSLKGQTINNRSVHVMGGELVARPFASSTNPFVPESSSNTPYGRIDKIQNSPGESRSSTYTKDFGATNIIPQEVGATKKLLVPYHPHAQRNRIKHEFKRLPRPFVSQIDLSNPSVLNTNVHPYRTITSVTQAPTVRPMHTRVGFTNADITASFSKRAHKSVLG